MAVLRKFFLGLARIFLQRGIAKYAGSGHSAVVRIVGIVGLAANKNFKNFTLLGNFSSKQVFKYFENKNNNVPIPVG